MELAIIEEVNTQPSSIALSRRSCLRPRDLGIDLEATNVLLFPPSSITESQITDLTGWRRAGAVYRRRRDKFYC